MTARPSGPGRARFATTRWSLVLALKQQPGEPAARAALSTLCETYWFPVYGFLRRSGRSSDDAADLTQGFFTTVLEKDYFQQADRQRGRLRSFLLSSLRHFVANEFHFASRQKRGGGQPLLSLEFEDGERRYAREPAETLTPEDLYERDWALVVLGQATRAFDEKHRSRRGHGSKLFRPLRPYVFETEPASYAGLAAELGTSEGSLRVTLHRMRQQFVQCLRDAIADTVETDTIIEGELRHLLKVLGRHRAI